MKRQVVWEGQTICLLLVPAPPTSAFGAFPPPLHLRPFCLFSQPLCFPSPPSLSSPPASAPPSCPYPCSRQQALSWGTEHSPSPSSVSSLWLLWAPCPRLQCGWCLLAWSKDKGRERGRQGRRGCMGGGEGAEVGVERSRGSCCSYTLIPGRGWSPSNSSCLFFHHPQDKGLLSPC